MFQLPRDRSDRVWRADGLNLPIAFKQACCKLRPLACVPESGPGQRRRNATLISISQMNLGGGIQTSNKPSMYWGCEYVGKIFRPWLCLLCVKHTHSMAESEQFVILSRRSCVAVRSRRYFAQYLLDVPKSNMLENWAAKTILDKPL